MPATSLRAWAHRARLSLFSEIEVRTLYLVMSIGLLSPLASANVMPASPDHANHTAYIVEARAAFEEGQFPLRVAPFASDHNRYPLFQFYSQTPYVLGGLIYKYLTPNPWQALKLVDLIALFSAAWYTYRLAMLISFDRHVAVLMGVCFISAPYVLINFHVRGAFTEAVGQCILPAIGYWTTQLVRRRGARDLVGVTIAWGLLGTSHLITFVFATFFLAIFLALLLVYRAVSFRTAVVCAVAALPGWAVSAFQWYPAATTGPLKVASFVGGVFNSNWLTPLSALISVTGTQPEPAGGQNPWALNPTIGVPMLIAALGCGYFAWTGALRPAAKATLVAFAIAAFMTWSPFDFWSYMPAQFWIVQFTYRLLTFTVVFGCLLSGYFLTEYQARIGSLPFLPVLVVLVLFAAPFAPTMPRAPRTIHSVIAAPLPSYGAGAYEFVGAAADSAETKPYETKLPIVYGDGWLMLGQPVPITRGYIQSRPTNLLLTGSNALPTPGCSLLTLRLDGAEVASTSISPGNFSWRIPVALIAQRLTGESGKLTFASDCGVVPAVADPRNSDRRQLWLRVSEARFDQEEVEVEQVRPSCHLRRDELRCDVRTAGPARVQIPQLYYPALLTLTVNGQKIPARRSSQARTLVAVDVPGGLTRITCRFSGSPVGNTISLVSSALVLLFAGWRFYDVRRRGGSDRFINSPVGTG